MARAATQFRALTKIRLREMPDINSRPTGDVLESGEVFEVADWVKPPSPGLMGYLRVAGKSGWVFNKGVSGAWLEKPIVERLTESEVRKTAAEVQMERDQEEERAAADAERDEDVHGPAELDIIQLVSWGRGQPGMKVHPGLSVRGSHLIVSLPIAKGTPLVGVMPELVLKDAPDVLDSADEFSDLIKAAGDPDQWHLRLGLRLLKERSGGASTWQSYLRSMPPRPPAPLLWKEDLVAELQDRATRQAVQEQAAKISAFVDVHLKARPDAAPELPWAAAAAWARAVEIEGQRLLIPLVDLVGPPEGLAAEAAAGGGAAPLPACEVAAEGGGEDVVYVLYAARDLQPGATLTRDLGLGGDELLFGHGLVAGGRPGDRVSLTGCILEGTPSWKVRAISGAMRTRPGRLQGDLEFSGELCRCEELSEAISESFLHVARVLTCATEDELEVYVGNPGQVSEVAGDSSGLIGLFGARRTSAVEKLIQLIKACRGEFATTMEEDAKSLESAEGKRRTAIGFRLEKKRVIEDVLGLLERERAEPRQGALPFAVTGTRP